MTANLLLLQTRDEQLHPLQHLNALTMTRLLLATETNLVKEMSHMRYLCVWVAKHYGVLRESNLCAIYINDK